MTNEAHVIKVGIIGLGAIGGRLLKAFEAHPKTKVTAVCDVNESLAQEVAQETNSQWFTQYQDLLMADDVELVYVAVPPKFHHQIVLDAIKALKHILCEKPLANSVEEAREMAERVNESGLVHAINFPLHYSTSIQRFEELIQSGYVGEVRRIEAVMNFPKWPRSWQENTWVGGREQGGFVREVGPHVLQVLLRVFGSLTPVSSELEFPENPSLSEIGLLARMKLPNGAPVMISGMSQIAGATDQVTIKVYGSKGTLYLDNWLSSLAGGLLGEEINEIPVEVNREKRPWEVVDQLVEAIQGNKAHISDFNMGLAVQIALEALRNPNSKEL